MWRDRRWAVHSAEMKGLRSVVLWVVAKDHSKAARSVDLWVAKRGSLKVGRSVELTVAKKDHRWVDGLVVQKDSLMAVHWVLSKAGKSAGSWEQR